MPVVAIIVVTVTVVIAAVVIVIVAVMIIVAPLLVTVITVVLLPQGASSPISFFGIGLGVLYLQHLADGSCPLAV
jgi:hypothetical protein